MLKSPDRTNPQRDELGVAAPPTAIDQILGRRAVRTALTRTPVTGPSKPVRATSERDILGRSRNAVATHRWIW